MWTKILHILCFFLYFGIENANENITLNSSFPIMYKTIFQSTPCVYRSKVEFVIDCKMNLKENTLHFECHPEYNFCQGKCYTISGSFNLDKYAINSFHCLAKRQGVIRDKWCEKSDEYHQRNIFKNCNKSDVSQFFIHGNSNTTRQCLNSLASDLPNLKQINMYNIICLPLNEFLRNFKDLNTLDIYIRSFTDIIRCDDNYLTNLTQIKELTIGVKPSEENYMEVPSILNKQLLRGLQNLELFELRFTIPIDEVSIPSQLFEGLNNLSSLRFFNLNIKNLTEDHFKDLVNLKSLAFIGGLITDFDWLGSTIIQNNLTFLELDMDIDNFTQKHNLSAFICQGTINCVFNVDINKKTCPKGCQCSLNRTELRFEIDCDKAEIGMKIPELPIPITGSASLYFNNMNLTELPNLSLYGYSNVRELHLANNKLTRISVEQLPPNLTYLDLRNNSIESLERNVVKFLFKRAGKIILKLSGNPWKCHCNNLDMLQLFLNSFNIVDRDNLKCNDDILEASMHFLESDDCKHNMYKILAPILGLAIMILTCLQFKRTISMWLYERNWIFTPSPTDDSVLKVDAFLAFSHMDLGLIKEYIERLEQGPRKYKLWFYQRDWPVGASIPECILKSVKDSKRIIILMTNSFINSCWGRFEFRTAIQAISMDKDKRLIVILYPGVDIEKLDSELKIFMKFNTYLCRDDPLFWSKLMFAMPHKQIQCGQPALKESQAIEDDQL